MLGDVAVDRPRIEGQDGFYLAALQVPGEDFIRIVQKGENHSERPQELDPFLVELAAGGEEPRKGAALNASQTRERARRAGERQDSVVAEQGKRCFGKSLAERRDDGQCADEVADCASADDEDPLHSSFLACSVLRKKKFLLGKTYGTLRKFP